MIERSELLLGKEKLTKLANAKILVFGVGGVGGYVCEMLARCGIGEITIVDFDIVENPDLNRQIIALHSTLNMPKVEAMKNRLKDINPNIIVNAINKKYEEECSKLFFEKPFDYVVDAIDIVTDKVHLIKTCHDKNLPIVSAMGAGNRYEIPVFEVADIYKTQNDGLAKIMRKKLKENGINKHTVVYTKQNPLPNGREIGSVSYYPSMCGCVLAAFVVNQLICKN